MPGNSIRAYDTLHEAIVDEETGEVVVVSVTKGERDYIDARIEGKDEVEAMKEAGLTPAQLWTSKKRGDLQLYMREKIIEAGLDHKPVIEKIKEGLEATKYVTVSSEHVEREGDFRDGVNIRNKDSESVEVPDHAIRHLFLRTLLELQGLVGGMEVEPNVVNNNTVNFIQPGHLEGRDEGELLAMTVARARAIKEGKTFIVPDKPAGRLIEGEEAGE